MPWLVPLVVTVCPKASRREVAWQVQAYELQGLLLGSRRVVPGSSPFSGGAGCIPELPFSLCQGWYKTFPRVLGCHSSGLLFSSARSPTPRLGLQAQDSVTSGSGAG